MIGEFENIAVSTGYPETNICRFTGIKSIFLTDPLFSFDTIADFEDKAQWIADIKAQNIFQVLGLFETELQNEATEYIKSDLGYQFEGNKGKYIFNFKALYKKEYHDQLSKWSGKPCRVFFTDANNNVFANKIGARIYGLDVDLINIEKKTFGSIEPAYTIIRVELSDSDEFDHVSKMDFAINKINPVSVVISDLIIEGNLMEFTVKDSIYDIAIQNIYTGFVITGESLTINSIAFIGCGKYRITASGSFSDGNIAVDNDYYYSDETHYHVGAYLKIVNIDYTSNKIIRFNVTDDTDNLLTGVVLGEITITDSIEGVATINDLTVISPGLYQCTTDEPLTSGTISVTHDAVSGSASYEVDISLIIVNITSLFTNTISFEVEEALSGNPVTDLIAADFLISDAWSGDIDINDFDVVGNLYTLGLAKPRTNGNIYMGSYGVQYDFTSVSFKNSGAAGATDLVDTNSDGLADYFSKIMPTKCTAIITEEYLGRMQNLTQDSYSSSPVGLSLPIDYFKSNRYYKLTFEYYRLNGGTGSDRFMNISLYGLNDLLFSDSLSSGDAGNPTHYISSEIYIPENISFLQLGFTFKKIGMKIQISRMQLIEV